MESTSIYQTKPKLTYPSKNQTWGLAGMFLGSSILAAIVVIPLQSLLSSTSIDAQMQGSITDFVGYCIPMAFTIWYGVREKRMQRANWNFAFDKAPLFVMLLLIPITLSVGVVVEPVIETIPMPDFIKQLFEKFFKNTWLSFVLIGIVGPILEELLLRGIVLEGLLKNYSPRFSILFSAFIFGLIHLNPWQFLAAFVIGVLMGWTYWKTNSLWPCILMHVLNNSLSATAIMILDDPWASTKQLVGEDSYLFVYGAAVLIFGLGIWYLHQYFQRQQPPSDYSAT